ncbi:MAG: thiamine-phosphate kinase [Myxococcales bacterium]|jgi:thiamine-monophosphate kinase|nr:thiamine-phosphate kinase [Myxococcales bacterium]
MTSEFGLIDAFTAPFEKRAPGLLVGPGDDCALTSVSDGMALCATVDALVEGVHFLGAIFEDAEIGHKALAINLSDLAAMGARPRWFLCSVACPADAASMARLTGISRGMAALAQRAGILLIGGNFTRAEALSLHITALGEVPTGQAMLRSGACVGDVLFVSGTLGGAALALGWMREGRPMPDALRQRQSRPEPRLELGLLARDFASAAMDVSDGLLQDLAHLIEKSGHGFEVDLSKLPLDPALVESGAPLDLALTGGEDYELLLTVPQSKAVEFERACAQRGMAVTAIGRARSDDRLELVNAPSHLSLTGTAKRGFDHFG